MSRDRDWYPCAQCRGGFLEREEACRVGTPDGVCEPCLRVNRALKNLREVEAEIASFLRGDESDRE